MYEDQPGSMAFEHARRLHFGEHPLGNSVLGTKESVAALAREQMAAYHRRRYVAPNITVAAAGAYEWDELVNLIENHCGHWESGPIGREGISEIDRKDGFEVVVKEKVAQEHVFLMAPGPSAESRS